MKTAGTNWDVAVEEVRPQDLFSGNLGPGILAMSFHAAESGQHVIQSRGLNPSVGHTVLILNGESPASLEVFDPAPDYGFETWSEDVLANVRHGILLHLVPRDGTQPAVKFDLAALRHDSNDYPSVVRR